MSNPLRKYRRQNAARPKRREVYAGLVAAGVQPAAAREAVHGAGWRKKAERALRRRAAEVAIESKLKDVEGDA